MTSSRFRRRRRTDRKLVLDGDFPDTGESVTEILERVRPADYDGTTITFGGASVAGLESGAAYEADPAAGLRQAIEMTAMAERGRGTRPMAAPEPAPGCPCCPSHHPGEDCPGCGHSTGAITGICYPAPVREEPAARQVSGKGWSMTVNTGGPGVPMDARCRNALAHLRLEAADYEAQGMSYRIDDAEQVRMRGEDLDERSVIGVTISKAVRHLLGPRQPWDPEA